MPLELVTPLSVLVHMNVDDLKDTDIDRDRDLRIAPDGTLLVSFPSACATDEGNGRLYAQVSSGDDEIDVRRRT